MLHKEINLFYLLWYHPRKDFQVGVWFLVFCPFEVGGYYFALFSFGNITQFNALTTEGALMTHIDFTLSN